MVQHGDPVTCKYNVNIKGLFQGNGNTPSYFHEDKQKHTDKYYIIATCIVIFFLFLNQNQKTTYN